jgi:hypothetical protein
MARESTTNPETRWGENGNGNPEHTDPLTGPPRTPDELRRLNLEQDRAGGAMWLWIVGVAAVILVVVLIYGYKVSTSNTVGPPPSEFADHHRFRTGGASQGQSVGRHVEPGPAIPTDARTRPWASRRINGSDPLNCVEPLSGVNYLRSCAFRSR